MLGGVEGRVGARYVCIIFPTRVAGPEGCRIRGVSVLALDGQEGRQ